MNGFQILDLVVGMIFIYFLLSIICSSATELWFSVMKTRSRLLAQWLKKIFDTEALDSEGKPMGKSVGQAIMDHCMVTALSKENKATSYINSKTFTLALLDKITILPSVPLNQGVQLPPDTLDEYILAIQSSTVISGELKRTILSLAYQAQAATDALHQLPVNTAITAGINTIKSDLDVFFTHLENWYDNNAERLTASMKRKKAVPATLFFGLLITVLLNADSASFSNYLYNHPQITQQFAANVRANIQDSQARLDSLTRRTQQAKDTTAASSKNSEAIKAQVKELQDNLKQLQTTVPAALPMGWQQETYDFKGHFVASVVQVLKIHGLGWLITLLAISLGAPFWFDLLNKIANIRSSGPRPVSSLSEKDKQAN